ncbi:MAG: TPM domain-containing protein, partial [Rhodocyclaceae bacterium]|nr:TPM domain-containing protein [Rhodocyclaceae bacterium]
MLFACLLAGAGAGAATPADAGSVAIPRLAARVTDLTGTLTAEQRASVEAELAAFESRKGAQIAVLMLPTTGPEPIEAFGIRLAETWKIGRKGIDDGVILIVAKDDRRLRIEVGYGLEGALNDATAKRIVSDTITPAFRQGDFAGGITAGLRAVMAVIDG